MSLELSNAKEYIQWMHRKAVLNDQAKQSATKQIRRGEVYWCEFGLNIGSEMSKATPRPAVIVQNNSANRSSSNTIVVPVTHDHGNGYYLVPLTTQNLPDGSILLDGKANVTNISCISKARLLGYITRLPASDMKNIDAAIARELSVMNIPASASSP